jgi:hypothetical protein
VRVVFTDHALERGSLYGIAYHDIADAVLDQHEHRKQNPGSGDWLLRRGALVVVYNWPDADDAATARVITVWTEE